MWFLNTKTGLKWDVEGELAKRLSLDPDFMLIAEPNTNSSTKQRDDFESMKWHDLLKYAANKGINTKGLKKADIIARLQE